MKILTIYALCVAAQFAQDRGASENIRLGNRADTMIVNDAIVGRTGDDILLTRSLGTNGGRLRVAPSGQYSAIQSAQLELVPGANCDAGGQICSEILLFNKTGRDYERFVMATVNDQYMFVSDSLGNGVNRNIYFRIGDNNNIALSNNNVLLAPDAGSVFIGTVHGNRTVNVGASPGGNALTGYFESTMEKWAVGHDARAHAFTWYNAATGHSTLTMPDATDNAVLFGTFQAGGYKSSDGTAGISVNCAHGVDMSKGITVKNGLITAAACNP
jgi:hypothetical protein